MPTPSTWDHEARKLLAAAARDDRGLATAVVRFHRRLDEVIAQSIAVHAVPIACVPGCSFCCHLPVHVKPYEAFALADRMRQNLGAAEVEAILGRARAEALENPKARRRWRDGKKACTGPNVLRFEPPARQPA